MPERVRAPQMRLFNCASVASTRAMWAASHAGECGVPREVQGRESGFVVADGDGAAGSAGAIGSVGEFCWVIMFCCLYLVAHGVALDGSECGRDGRLEGESSGHVRTQRSQSGDLGDEGKMVDGVCAIVLNVAELWRRRGIPVLVASGH